MTRRTGVALVRTVGTLILLSLVLFVAACGDPGPGVELESQASSRTTTGETESTVSASDYKVGLVIHLSPSATPPEVESLFRPLGLPRYPFDDRINYTSMTAEVLWFGDPSDGLVESYIQEISSSPIVVSVDRVG